MQVKLVLLNLRPDQTLSPHVRLHRELYSCNWFCSFSSVTYALHYNIILPSYFLSIRLLIVNRQFKSCIERQPAALGDLIPRVASTNERQFAIIFFASIISLCRVR